MWFLKLFLFGLERKLLGDIHSRLTLGGNVVIYNMHKEIHVGAI